MNEKNDLNTHLKTMIHRITPSLANRLYVLLAIVLLAAPVCAQEYTQSGIFRDTVVLYDYEDHNWTYYQTEANGGVPGLNSPDPRNVKITYQGGSVEGGSPVAVSKYESQNTFIYYKTLEKLSGTSVYPYKLIPNPFSKRPSTGSAGTAAITKGQKGRGSKTYYGFAGWKVVSVSGGEIRKTSSSTTTYAANDVIPAETDVYFVPSRTYSTNCQSMEVVLEAKWEAARVIFCTPGSMATYITDAYLNKGSVEKNFLVLFQYNAGGTTLNFSSSSYSNVKPVTITQIEPDGGDDFRTSGRYFNYDIILGNDMKFEWINIVSVKGWNLYFTANGYNLTLGRGIENPVTSLYAVKYVRNFSANRSTTFNNHIRIESGYVGHISYTRNTFSGSAESTTSITLSGNNNYVRGTLGCDYDRAANDNSKLRVSQEVIMGSTNYIGTTTNHSKSLDVIVKSGDIICDKNSNLADAQACIYLSSGIIQTYVGKRYLTMEGGQVLGIAGGIDSQNDVNDTTVTIRVKGGTVRSSIYGAAAYAATRGHRKIIVTGGTIRGWVGGACNGTSDDSPGGTLPSNTYVYIGGNASVNSNGNTSLITYSLGGNVFGAGSGNVNHPTTGQVNYSTVCIADNAYVERDVFGGGNMGYASEGSWVYMRGGTVNGRIFGGSNKKQGKQVRLYMTGGTVQGGIYGGSNETGDMYAFCQVNVLGGTVGSSSAPARICGGGLGSPTKVYQNIDVNIGAANTTGPTIYADIYGGSALGKVNTHNSSDAENLGYNSTRHTYVTVNSGDVYGDVYGGGLGDGSNQANTYGKSKVTINGGTINGTVFGCNNINGRPYDKTVVVEVNGGTMHNVYGGGNAAAYTGSTTVTIQGNAHVTQNVYGGGLGATAKLNGHSNNANYGNTHVTVKGNAKVDGNIYGGGNGAEVTGNTEVVVGEQTEP